MWETWVRSLGWEDPLEKGKVTHSGILAWRIPWTMAVQFSSVAQSCLALCDPMNHSTPGLPVYHQLPEFTQTQSIESVMPSNHLILCCPLLLLPSIFPSIRVFSNESALRIRGPKYWSFSFNISASNEHPGLISFRMDWLDLLAVQGTLKSLLQHHSSKASILRCSVFFIVQLSHRLFMGEQSWTLLSDFHFHFCIHSSKNFQGNLYQLISIVF